MRLDADLFPALRTPMSPAVERTGRGAEFGPIHVCLMLEQVSRKGDQGRAQVIIIRHGEKPKPDGSQVRPLETAQPLAESLGLQVNTAYKKADASGLARPILSDPAYRGKMVLASVEHHVIPAIAQALGWSQTPDWADCVFDRARILNFDGGKPVSLQNVPQKLLPGDSTN